MQKIAKAGGFLLVLLALLFAFSPVSRLWGLAYVAYFPFGIASYAFIVFALFAEGVTLMRFEKTTGRIPARIWVGAFVLALALSLTLSLALPKDAVSLGSFADFFARYNAAGNVFAGFFLETGVYGGVLGFVLAGLVAQYLGTAWLITLFALLFLIALAVMFFPHIVMVFRAVRSRRAILRSKRKRIEEEERAQRESLEHEINDYGSPDIEKSESAPMPHEIPVPVFHYERPAEEDPDGEEPYAPEPPRVTRETRRFVRASNAFYSTQTRGQGAETGPKATPSSSAPGLPKDLPTPMPGPFSDAPVRHVGLQPAYLVGPGGTGLDTGPGLSPLFPMASEEPKEEPKPQETPATSQESPAPSPVISVPSPAKEEEEAPLDFAPDLEAALRMPAPGLPEEPPTIEAVTPPETELAEEPAPTEPEPAPAPEPKPIPMPAPKPAPRPAPAQVPAQEEIPEEEVPAEEDEPAIPEPLPEYVLPSLDVIDPPSEENEKTLADMEEDSQRVIADIDRFFEEFGIRAKVVNHTIGPSITTYEVRPEPGVPVSTIRSAQVDLDVALEGIHSRFMERVPGTRNCALEIQNKIRRPVSFYETIVALKDAPLQIPFGVDIKGNLIQSSLRKFVHMLV
ncbi:MAG: DNA translocase FtsK, partial [Candidatus Enteromonas sp.]